MKVAIIEDETLASNYLKNILEQQTILPVSEIHVLKSVANSIAFFKDNKVDLAFMDIHLGDGKSLEIFETTPVSCPIIFITAYDSYAVKVFKHFTIDYLLKPYEEEDLFIALEKFKNIRNSFNSNILLESLVEIENKNDIQHHFLVNHRDKLLSIADKNIAYFFASGKHLFLYTGPISSYLYNSSLTDLIANLDPKLFFKVNRKYILHRKSIAQIVKHSSQKIEIILTIKPADLEPIILSKKEINKFKNWLDS